jgi:HlyD family secretion protein
VKLLITVLITVVVVLAVGSGLWFARGRGEDDAMAVRIEPVASADLVEIVSAPGLIEAETKVSISARVAARIVELPFEEGDVVKKGESVLVKLDSKDLEAQLRAVEARSAAQASQIEMAQAQLASGRNEIEALRVELADAERDLERQKGLLNTQDVSQSIVDVAQAKVDRLRARLQGSMHTVEASEKNLQVMRHQLEAAQAEILRAKDNLSYTTIVSPIDGVVTKLNAEVGELVVTGTMNNPGTVIMEVADLSTMIVKARVDETSIADLEVGQKAKVNVQAYEDEVFDGTVQSVALAATEEKDGSKNYKAEILLHTNGRKVLSGLSADVDIETKRHPGVLRIPSQSVLGKRVDDLPGAVRDASEVDKTRNLCPVVFRFVDGKAIMTPVTVGPSDITHTAILSGLKHGELVITGPYKVFDKLEHEKKVKDEKATTQPTTAPGDGSELAKKPNGNTASAR